jgi:hypothetical protein
MFDLEQAVVKWRRQMLAAGIKAPVPLDELEVHLRDEVREQTQAGIGEQPAFESAVQKLGCSSVLKNEFELVQRPASSGERKAFMGVLGFSLLSLFMFALPMFRLGTFAKMDLQQLLSCFSAIALALLLGWGGWFGYSVFPVISNARMRSAIFISNAILATLWELIFLYVIALRSGFNLEQLLVAFIWSFVLPQGLLVGSFAGLERAALRRTPIRHAIARAHDATLAFAGIPDHYFDASMNTSPTLEPGWATYLRSAAFLAPAVIIWMLATTYVMPQMNAITQAPKVHETWSKVAASPAIVFVRVGRLNNALGYEFRDHPCLILGAVSLGLGLLEWRSVRWPRYRRAIIGSGVFLLNVLLVLSLGIMFLMTALEAQALFVDFK